MSRRAAAAAAPNNTVHQEAPSDSDLDAPTTTVSKPTTSKAPSKRGRKAAESAAPSKAKVAKTRRTSNSKQNPVKEIPATQAPEESADEFDLPPSDTRAMSTPMTAMKTRADASVPAAAPAKANSESATKPKAKRACKTKEIKTEIPDTQVEDVEGDAQASSNFGRTVKSTKQPRPAKREVVPATQAEDAMDLDGAVTEKEEPRKARPRNPSPQTHGRKRAADDSSTQSDAATKRKLTDLSKRFESLEMRYEQLKDVGVREAEASFEELKRRTDERQKAADNLVSHLRTEVAKQSTAAAEAGELKSEVEGLNVEAKKLRGEKTALGASLGAAQGEIRTLAAKLAATRAGSEQRIPGSAAKVGKSMPGSAAMDAQKMAVKEQLYGDLTGLIIRDVKKREDEEGVMDVYDCIQTGRNGTLHFHLAVPNPQPAGVPYGDADIEYTPLLDPSNDKILLEILPDYLTDEILFPQREAQRFYGRINEFIMKSRPAQQVPQEENDEVDGDGDAA